MKGAVAIIFKDEGKQERVGILLSETTVEPIGSQVFRKVVGYAGMTVEEGLRNFTNQVTAHGFAVKHKGGGSDYAIVTLLDTVLI